MSLILEALKKLERERAARSGAKVDVAGEILRTRDVKPRSRSRALIVGTAAAVTTAAVVTLALTLGPGLRDRQAPAAPEESKATAAPAARTPAAPAPPAPADEKAASAAAAKSVPAAAPGPAVREAPREAAARTGPARVAAPREEEAPAREAASGKPSADMKITGIVWEEDRRARRAFVNGRVASEGSVVDGAKVVEIRPDSVRFSRDGRTFEVPMFQ